MTKVYSIFSNSCHCSPAGNSISWYERHRPSATPEDSPVEASVAMLFGQLGRAHSLFEIRASLAPSEGKLSYLGIQAPNRSILAYANAHRPSNATSSCSTACWRGAPAAGIPHPAEAAQSGVHGDSVVPQCV